MVVGQDDDGLDRLGKRPGVLADVRVARFGPVGKQGLNILL